MTITTNDTRDEYTATGGQTTFNYTFKIFADTDLLVYQTASGATPDDATDLITAYTVTGVGNAGGGTIVLDTGATLNDKITIVSNISYERDTDYQFNGDYTADVVNDEQDKQLSLIKQVKEEISRTMQFPRAAQSATGKVLPQPSDLADCVLAFDSNGDPVAGPSSTSMQALIDAAEAVLLNSNAGAVSFSNTASGLAATNVQDAVDEVDADLDTAQSNISSLQTNTANLATLSGVAANSTSLGAFTGTTIPDNRTIKQALQELETTLEAVDNSIPVTSEGSGSATVTGVSNVTSAASGYLNFVRVAVGVAFSGRATITPTGAGATLFSVTPSVASNFAAVEDCLGTAATTAGEAGIVYADVSGNKIYVAFTAAAGTARTVYFSGVYYVL